jgi:hypothetical protein
MVGCLFVLYSLAFIKVFLMRKIVSILLLAVLFSACSQKETEKVKPSDNLNLGYNLIEVKDPLNRSGWGYEIIVEKKLFISQTAVPDIGGNRVFKAQEDAAKVARLVIQKIRDRPDQMPAVSVRELSALQVIDLEDLYVEVTQQISGGWSIMIMLDRLPVIGFDSFPGFDQGLRTKDAALKVGEVLVERFKNFQSVVLSEEDLKAIEVTL